jgi:hypothetical protein
MAEAPLTFPGIVPGLRGERSLVVSEAMTTVHAGGGGILTAPSMIMEMDSPHNSTPPWTRLSFARCSLPFQQTNSRLTRSRRSSTRRATIHQSACSRSAELTALHGCFPPRTRPSRWTLRRQPCGGNLSPVHLPHQPMPTWAIPSSPCRGEEGRAFSAYRQTAQACLREFGPRGPNYAKSGQNQHYSTRNSPDFSR